MTLGLLRPCLDCGEPSDESRCPEHLARTRARVRGTAEERGYDAAWRRLSARARRLQPFCSDCGATSNLTTDHSPEAWHARENRRPITLRMVDVVCGPCNTRRGEARPGSPRYAAWTAGRTYP